MGPVGQIWSMEVYDPTHRSLDRPRIHGACINSSPACSTHTMPAPLCCMQRAPVVGLAVRMAHRPSMELVLHVPQKLDLVLHTVQGIHSAHCVQCWARLALHTASDTPGKRGARASPVGHNMQPMA